jgi:hypothetical protein
MYDIIVDHADQAAARLTSGYSSKPSVVSLVRVLADQIQLLENAAAHVNADRLLYGGRAEGAQLDVLGKIIGLPRGGLDDATYYVLLYGTIAKNNSDATLAAILNVVALVYQASAVFLSDPNTPGADANAAPAQVQIAVGDAQTDPGLYPKLLGILRDSIGAAIAVASVAGFSTEGVLACAGPQAWVRGFSDIDGNLGGPAATLLYSNAEA